MNATPPPGSNPCDDEPIHIPGSIQPHGMLLVADREGLLVQHGAGDIAKRLGVEDWLGGKLEASIGASLAAQARATASGPEGSYLGQLDTRAGERLDVSAHLQGSILLVELEPAAPVRPASAILADLEASAAAFQNADSVQALCDVAAAEFRRLTGFDRVMVYRFLDGGTGRVVAEARSGKLPSFLNHHFPATDIPRQARALYVRNLVRTIQSVEYQPAPILPAPATPLDLSDCGLRSVSPIHLQYLRNMGVAASASVSIVAENRLWGLIACHHDSPRGLAHDLRGACRSLARVLGPQIGAAERAEGYRERLRLRSLGDVCDVLSREGPMRETLARHLDDVMRALRSDGVAVICGAEIVSCGRCPPEPEIEALARWIAASEAAVFATEQLMQRYPRAERFSDACGGVLALTLCAHEPWQLLWFRGEQAEVVNWAGNPHKAIGGDPSIALSPRASFEQWREIVRGRSREWTAAEIEAAGRLRAAILDARQSRRIRELNHQLSQTLRDKDLLLDQKQYLIGEVNHRVQNSLQLVASFLSSQAQSAAEPATRTALGEATRRLGAVALMHRRLYRGKQVQLVDLGTYVEDLCADALAALGDEWRAQAAFDLAPVLIESDRAIALGLILTELMINASKYAYGGAAGPLHVRLGEEAGHVQLCVSDSGVGRATSARGFGSRIIDALISQLSGTISYADNAPGLRILVTAPTRGSSDRGSRA